MEKITIKDRKIVKTSTDTVGINLPIQYIKDGLFKVGDTVNLEVTVIDREVAE